MANAEHLENLQQGREHWNQWRSRNPELRIDLTSAYLSETSLEWAEPMPPPSLTVADFSRFDLTNAVLSYTILKGANLREAKLAGADLRGSNLRRADLRGADLRGVKLFHSNLTLANLSGADLTGATFWETVLARVNFSRTKGLETCHHGGPSILDERTLWRSGGLPTEFLRGCGLSERLINYFPTLLTRVPYDSCFISHSSTDQEFARSLYKRLQSRGVRCWFAPDDMKIGDRIRDKLDVQILSNDRLLLVLSEHSVLSSWVESEVEAARSEEHTSE